MNHFGVFQKANLLRESISGQFDIIVGGPPCKPWSAVNTVRRGKTHRDYSLLSRFFEHIQAIKPMAFLLENVPLIAKDETLKTHISQLRNRKHGYSIDSAIVKYSLYGAPTKRHRFILFGTKVGNASRFFERLTEFESYPPKTVKDAIWELRDKQENEVADHDWPKFRTIKRYVDKYQSNKFGWYILNWAEPAPSFGNITKTYILHPDAFNGGTTRVISVKEAALIMGFNKEFLFPKGLSRASRYQMIVDSVSPVFSTLAAKIVRSEIYGEH